MQAIGKGAESTHYGNNVTMSPGTNFVTVAVNDKKAVFTVQIPETPSDSKEKMDMHDMH